MITSAWTLEEASAFCDQWERLLSSHGFLLSIYGSTVRRGRGRDLDVILIQKRTGVSPAWTLKSWCLQLNAEELGEATPSLFADLCQLLRLPNGKLIDIQVRLSRNRIDALDLYESQWQPNDKEQKESR